MSAAYAARLASKSSICGQHDAGLEAEEAVQPRHPLRVELREVVVHGDEVRAAAGERVEVERQRGDEGLALTGLHLGDPAEVERGAAHDLDVEVTLAEGAQATFADDRERLGEDVVEEVGARVVVLGLVEALAERERAGGAGRRRSGPASRARGG